MTLFHRDPSKIGKLEKHPDILSNQLRIGGTRIPVSSVLSFVDAGYSTSGIIEQYPTLVKADIEAAIQHRIDRSKGRAETI